MKLTDSFVWQERSGVRLQVRTLQAGEESIARLLTTIATPPGRQRRGFMAGYGSGLVLNISMLKAVPPGR
jgi:hypothetical protein